LFNFTPILDLPARSPVEFTYSKERITFLMLQRSGIGISIDRSAETHFRSKVLTGTSLYSGSFIVFVPVAGVVAALTPVRAAALEGWIVATAGLEAGEIFGGVRVFAGGGAASIPGGIAIKRVAAQMNDDVNLLM
jgi:hypothetical protein